MRTHLCACVALCVAIAEPLGLPARRDRLCVYPCRIMVAITKLFLSNRSQAVRIPADLRLPDSVKDVEVRACGQERIIAPLGRSWDSFFLDGPTVSDDFLEERGAQEQGEREPF